MADEAKLTLSEAKDKIEELRNRAKRITEKADGVIDKVVTAGVTMGAAGMIGLVEGYNGEEFKLGAADGAAVLAIGAHALGAMGDSKYAEQIHNAGNGFGCVWSYKTFKRVGERMKKNKTEKGSILGAGAQAAGELGPGDSVSNYGGGAIVRHAAE